MTGRKDDKNCKKFRGFDGSETARTYPVTAAIVSAQKRSTARAVVGCDVAAAVTSGGQTSRDTSECSIS